MVVPMLSVDTLVRASEVAFAASILKIKLSIPLLLTRNKVSGEERVKCGKSLCKIGY